VLAGSSIEADWLEIDEIADSLWMWDIGYFMIT